MKPNFSGKMYLQIVVALSVGFLITAGSHYFIYQRVFLPLFGSHNGVSATIVACLWFFLFFGFGILRILPTPLRRIYEGLMFGWMGLGLFLVMAGVPVLVTSWILSFPVTPPQIAALTLALGLLLSVISFLKAATERVVEVDLPIVLPGHLESLQSLPGAPVAAPAQIRAVVLSDVHVSGLLGKRRLKAIVQKVNALNPDIIFVVGDLVDGSVRQLAQDVQVLDGLRSHHGVYFVTGNHEYYSGADSWKAHLRQALGWNVLANDAVALRIGGVRLHLVGIEDRQSLHFGNSKSTEDNRIAAALGRTPQGVTAADHLTVLLAHQPKDATQLDPKGPVDLQISGHTHGGQIWPFSYVVQKEQGFLEGLYELAPGQRLYVSQGTCFWGLPFRLGTQCEITLLNIHSA